MSYVALHHTQINGHLYSPGEIVDEVIHPKKAERLIALGALVSSGAPSVLNDAITPETDGDNALTDEKEREMTRQNYAAQLNGLGYEPDGSPIADKGAPEDEEAEAADDGENDTGDENAEDDEDEGNQEPPPEIDITDGIVKQPAPDQESAPAKEPTEKKPATTKKRNGGKAK